MTTYFVVCTIAFFFLFIVWSKRDLPNVILKLFWLGMGVWSTVLSLLAMGIITKG